MSVIWDRYTDEQLLKMVNQPGVSCSTRDEVLNFIDERGDLDGIILDLIKECSTLNMCRLSYL